MSSTVTFSRPRSTASRSAAEAGGRRGAGAGAAGVALARDVRAEPLQAFLAEASQRVRPVFHGPLTYASTPFEVVDWSLFDVIGVDHYRNSKVERRYAEMIRPYLGQG